MSGVLVRSCYRLLSLQNRFFSSNSIKFMQNEALSKTELHSFHVNHGARMVPFAKWSMPAVYGDLSIVDSVLHTRKSLSLFDVSHMLQLTVNGRDAVTFLESILVSDFQALPDRSSALSVLTNDKGGIVDDCIVTRTGLKSFYVVTNAACAEKVTTLLKRKLEECEDCDVQVSYIKDRSLIALQGPLLTSVMNEGVKGNLSDLYHMKSEEMDVFGIESCRVSRCGYTGEDGVEISVDSRRVVELCEKMMTFKAVKLAGLGCRDILRTEAGLCLYGNELSEDISPVEAGLSWCIGKRRKLEGGFPGSSVVLAQLPRNVSRKRVGLVSHGPVLRQNCEIVDDKGVTIGRVTSGCPSPTLKCNIAMAYVPRSVGKLNNSINVVVRKNIVSAIVTKLPFVPHAYAKKE